MISILKHKTERSMELTPKINNSPALFVAAFFIAVSLAQAASTDVSLSTASFKNSHPHKKTAPKKIPAQKSGVIILNNDDLPKHPYGYYSAGESPATPAAASSPTATVNGNTH